MDTTVAELNGEPNNDVESLLRQLHIFPAVEPDKLGHLAGKSSPGWGWC